MNLFIWKFQIFPEYFRQHLLWLIALFYFTKGNNIALVQKGIIVCPNFQQLTDL